VDYKIQVWKKDGSYYGQIRELSILVRDDDPAILVRKVEEAREELGRAYKEAELGDQELIQPIGAKTRLRWQNLSWFAAKAAVVTFAASILIVVTLSQAANSVRGLVIGAFDASGGAYVLVDRFARYVEGFPPERRRATQENLATIVKALQPMADTIRPLFGDGSKNGSTRSNAGQR